MQLWKACSEERDELKDEVRRMVLSAGLNWTEKLILINTIERLGFGYHFAEYIEDILAEMHNAHACTIENFNLSTTALYFRILRQHGYNVSSGKLKHTPSMWHDCLCTLFACILRFL